MSIFNSYKKYNQFKQDCKSNISFAQFLRLSSFADKYGAELKRRFGITNDLYDYQYLIDAFGIEKLSSVLDHKLFSTQEVAAMLLKGTKVEDDNYLLKDIRKMYIFTHATELDYRRIRNIIDPAYFRRRIFNSSSMVEIFAQNDISYKDINMLYNTYGNEIINEYNNDLFLRNKTIATLDEIGVRKIEDHITFYSDDDLKQLFERYLNKEELNDKETSIIMGVLLKTTDLIAFYGIDNLKNNIDNIKKEIHIGVFNDMVVNGKKYSQEDRDKFISVADKWTKTDFENYKNLKLLRSRIDDICSDKESYYIKSTIDKIIDTPINQINIDDMNDMYMDYEVKNRENIIDNLYDPSGTETIIIDDFSKLPKSLMIHYFDPNDYIFNIDRYISLLHQKRSEELGIDIPFTNDELASIIDTFNIKSNHFITDKSLNMSAIGQINSYDSKYYTNTCEQLCVMLETGNSLYIGNNCRSRFALGFSKKTLKPELIAVTADHNIHSNKNINYIESRNEFKDFSASYKEMINRKKDDNNEIVLFRNTYDASSKPSYVMYISNYNIDSTSGKRDIQLIKSSLKEAGLNIPLVIFDKYSIDNQLQVYRNNNIDDYDIERTAKIKSLK